MFQKILINGIGIILIVCLLFAGPTLANDNEVISLKLKEQPKITNIWFETDIREVLQDISIQAGINIMADDTVTGYVTLDVADIPLEKCLQMILAPGRFTFKKMDGYYLVGAADPSNPTFSLLTVTESIKLNYIEARNVPNLMSDFFKQFIKVDEKRNMIIITASTEMIARIKKDIQKMDVPVLKTVEIRLVSLEYTKSEKAEINLDALNMYLGKGLKRENIYGIQVGDQTFGASSEDDLRSFLTLRILSDLNEIKLTGDQKTTVLEGEEAKIARDKEGVIFILLPGEQYYALQKETVQAGQGVNVKVIRVTSKNEILLNLQGRLEDVKEIAEYTKTGQVIWIDRREIDTTLLLENYQTITIGTLTRKIREKQKGIFSKYISEREVETLFLLTANVMGTKKPPELKIDIDKKVEEFFTKVEKPEREIKFGLGAGVWFSQSIQDLIVIYEGQFSISPEIKLFGGGGTDDSWISYYGVKYSFGDILNFGVGGINSNVLDKTELMFTGGFSFGTDRFRLSTDYFYIPMEEKASGTRVCIEVRF